MKSIKFYGNGKFQQNKFIWSLKRFLFFFYKTHTIKWYENWKFSYLKCSGNSGENFGGEGGRALFLKIFLKIMEAPGI